MSNEKQETPVQKIANILRESGANVYVVAVASPEGNGKMRALLGMNGPDDDILVLLASVIRRLVDKMNITDRHAKAEVTAEILSQLMQDVVVGANGEVHSVGPL